MKIRTLDIKGIGGIRSLSVHFSDQMNILCGPNGVGKTTVLECVAHTFSANTTNILKRNATSAQGSFLAVVFDETSERRHELHINDFEPERQTHYSGLVQDAKKLFSFKVNRTFQYQMLDAVRKDTEKNEYQAGEEAKYGQNFMEIKNWFVNRYLYSAHPGVLTPEQIYNLELAKRCFSLLNPNFSFSKVLASSNEIMIQTPSGEIYYEYLSSGFKSCISLVFGIIKEIEFRFKSPTITADSFDGIVLIDEIELHLHPEWQSKILSILKDVFPACQFIVTTHSPHVIQGASPSEIIALEYNGLDVIERPLPETDSGFQCWTIEEVLTDVMGMEETRTPRYKELMRRFGSSIENEEYAGASETYEILCKVLHPLSPLRKLLRFQLNSIKEDNYDQA